MTTEPSPYAGTSKVATLSHEHGLVTLVEGQTFCLSAPSGNMSPHLPHGLFVLDTRVLSRWELLVDGVEVEMLGVEHEEPFHAGFVGRSHPPAGRADAEVVVIRHRHIGRGMRERIVVTNHGLEATQLVVELRCDVDFADLFEVKESRVRERGEHRHEVAQDALHFGHVHEGRKKEVSIRFSEPLDPRSGAAHWALDLAPGAMRELCVEVTVRLGDTALEPRFTCNGDDADAVPLRRMKSWRARLPSVDTDDTALSDALDQSGEDLGALRIFDPDHPDTPILAAGAPWFMTVFGRDSLLTAWMTLSADPRLADGVVETLARFQGTKVVPETEEEPGKILHEMRFGAATGLALGGGDIYYGSIDATPMFVMLTGELRKWDPSDELVERMLPHVDRAMEWIEQYGDRDGDGYVEYERQSDHGLDNQGWKDSWDAVRHADGRLAEPPIALCEVQGYVYGAYVARAHFAAEAGDRENHARYVEKARDLRERFNQDFWLEDEGFYALGLDGDKRPIDALASNVGHCLWSGIVDPERSQRVADRLLADDFFTGWGVRTLSASMAAYNPISYHNGSVWPHDNAICAAGLARYGHMEHANRIIRGQIDVATAHGGRLPELFAGFSRGEVSIPAAYPTSCSPQAWAAASPIMWLRTMLRFEPWATHDQLWVSPTLPEGITRLTVDGIVVDGSPVRVSARDGEVPELSGAERLRVAHHARPPLWAHATPPMPEDDGTSR